MIEIREIQTEQELKQALDMCYRVLGNHDSDLYSYEAWYKRWQDGSQPLVYAETDG